MAELVKCRGRCWFSQYGQPGLRLPRCTRCGAPNPKWRWERAGQVLMLGEADVAETERDMDERDW